MLVSGWPDQSPGTVCAQERRSPGERLHLTGGSLTGNPAAETARSHQKPMARPDGWANSLSSGDWFEDCALRQLTAFQVVPQRNQQLAGQGYDTDFVQPRAASTEAFLVPPTQGAIRLMA